MKKILVIGSPGAGKSCFARRLSALLGIKLYHLDNIWHKPDGSQVTREAFDRCLEKILPLDEWIIDGNYHRTLELRVSACDTVFFLDVPTDDCLSGIRQRIGRSRSDLPWTEEDLDPEFEQYVKTFRAEILPKMKTILDNLSNKVNFFAFGSRSEADEYIDNLVNDISLADAPIGRRVWVTVDRPCGSCHPDFSDTIYPINYGYVDGITTDDGEAQDAYILGVGEPVSRLSGVVVGVIRRQDDCEDKWVVMPYMAGIPDEDILNSVNFVERYFDSTVIRSNKEVKRKQ